MPPVDPIPALLSRLLAAGLEQAEYVVAASTLPGAPPLVYRFRGVFQGEWIAVDAIMDEAEAVEYIEGKVMEKIAAMKAGQQ